MSAIVDHIEVRYRPADAPDAWTYAPHCPPGSATVDVPLEPGRQHVIQARSVSLCGAPSEWVEINHTPATPSKAPNAPNNLTVSGMPDGLHCAWTLGDKRANITTELNIAPDVNDSPGPWVYADEVRGASDLLRITDADEHWVRARHVDYAGNVSAWTSDVKAKASANITTILNSIENAQQAADGKITTFWQDTAPTAVQADNGDLWFNTANGNRVYIRQNNAWQVARDTGIADAIAVAQTAQTIADGKANTYYSASAPSGASNGDLWYDTDADTVYQRVSGQWQIIATKGAQVGENLKDEGGNILGDSDIINDKGNSAGTNIASYSGWVIAADLRQTYSVNGTYTESITDTTAIGLAASVGEGVATIILRGSGTSTFIKVIFEAEDGGTWKNVKPTGRVSFAGWKKMFSADADYKPDLGEGDVDGANLGNISDSGSRSAVDSGYVDGANRIKKFYDGVAAYIFGKLAKLDNANLDTDVVNGTNYRKVGAGYADTSGRLTHFLDGSIRRKFERLASYGSIDYGSSLLTGIKPPSNADNTANNRQDYNWLTGTKPPSNATHGADWESNVYNVPATWSTGQIPNLSFGSKIIDRYFSYIEGANKPEDNATKNQSDSYLTEWANQHGAGLPENNADYVGPAPTFNSINVKSSGRDSRIVFGGPNKNDARLILDEDNEFGLYNPNTIGWVYRINDHRLEATGAQLTKGNKINGANAISDIDGNPSMELMAASIVEISGNSGGGGGTGYPTGGWCGMHGEWVVKRVRGKAKTVKIETIKVGDYIMLFNGDWGRVKRSEKHQDGCVRVTAGDTQVQCSASGKLLCMRERWAHAWSCIGAGLWTQHNDDEPQYQQVTSVEPIGIHDVQTIDLEGHVKAFLLGHVKDKWTAHHNYMKA